jgi:hypothetical protein
MSPKRSYSLMLMLLMFGLISHPVHAQSPSPSPESQQFGALECSVSCSYEKPGTAVAEIRWKATSRGALLAESLNQQRLDVTVYKDGFARKRFATVQPASATRGLSTFSAEPGVPLPAALHLRVVSVRMPGAAAGSSAERGLSPQAETVRVEGLEPGINYFWRLAGAPGSASTQTVRCQAPTCPVDNPRKER